MTDYDPHGSVDRWVRVWDEQKVFEADDLAGDGTTNTKPRGYIVSMFPYPSGDLHMGHAEVYSISDAMARFMRMRGRNVLNPIGWDSFGLPAENAALKRNLHPRTWTYDNIAVQAESFRRLGVSFDWRTRFHTSDPEYYRWNQWLFLRMFEKGLAYRKAAPVNWCPVDETVLANEQVVQGRCERCGTEVIRRNLTQWFFKTTAYAQRLLDDMDEQLVGAWPDDILAMQRNWIGRSTGAYIDFEINGHPDVRVFSTRPDTLYGATALVIAADSPLAMALCIEESRPELDSYRKELQNASVVERLASERPMTGVFLGRHALNPLTRELIPVYASDYVLAEYGTGAIMAVPAHDQRDLNFARAMELPIKVVIDSGQGDPSATGIASDGDGVLINSGAHTGLTASAAVADIAATLEAQGSGEATVIYRLRDWLLSRQRYWGTPIPIVHCTTCGEVAVPDGELPVRLPETGYELRPAGGKSPLESATEWVNVACPQCGQPARRDTDTMDTFVDSSWYFLRYPSPNYEDGPFSPQAIAKWLPVNEYIGGKEHATGHLMYARFLTKVLHDLGFLSFTEPFTRLTNQGQVIMNGKAMSKTLGNLVNLQEQIAAYGPDAVRVTMLFAGPAEEDIDWADVSPTGSTKWLARVWHLVQEVTERPTTDAGSPDDVSVRRGVHRLVADVTAAMGGNRFNVAIARLMSLTTLLRKAHNPAELTSLAVREGTEALVKMLSCVAPFLAEDAWERLGHEPSVATADWPVADPALLVEEHVTCIIQVAGKVRERIQVPPSISARDLEALAREVAQNSDKIKSVLAESNTRVIVKEPRLVNFVPAQ